MSQGQQFFVGNLFAPRWPDRLFQPSWESIHNIIKDSNEAPGWRSYRLMVESALLGEQEAPLEDGKFTYQFLVRQSGVRFLLACTAKEVLAYVLQIATLEHRVVSPIIDVAALVTAITERPKEYAISMVYARVDGYGQAFRSIAMYGSDLVDAKLFRDILPRVAPYRATLRSQLHREEVLTVSSRGNVSFVYRGSDSLREVDAVLRFLAQNKFMDWNLE